MATPRKPRLTYRCLWCSRPLSGKSSQLYCCDACRKSAWRARKREEALERVEWGAPQGQGIGSEDMASVLAEYKLCVARLALGGAREDHVGDVCRSLADLSKDAMKELGL